MAHHKPDGHVRKRDHRTRAGGSGWVWGPLSLVLLLAGVSLGLGPSPDPSSGELQAPAAQGISIRHPGWCDTEEVWKQKAALRDEFLLVCPTEGRCDDPIERNGHIPTAATPEKLIRLNFAVFREDDGSNPAADIAQIEAQVAQLNTDFEPYHIRFVYTFRLIDSSRYRHLTAADEDLMRQTFAERAGLDLNVYVSDFAVFDPPMGTFLGRATFPWDPDVLTNLGGLLLDDGAFGPAQRTATHEIGHCLGLWHPHHGFEDIFGCADPCYEQPGVAADSTGDFAGDTPPTPTNFTCDPPGGNDACSGTPWGPTQPENYMSYARDACLTKFTLHQAGRMHCWTGSRLSSWVRTPEPAQRSKLLPADGEASDYFGYQVAISGDTALVGALLDTDLGGNSGSAYVFTRSGGVWSEVQKLLPSDGAAGDLFGYSVAISGDTALVGAHLHGVLGTNSGSAYVFTRSGGVWSQVQKLLPADGSTGDVFGYTVAISGDTALVGAYTNDDFGWNSGSVHVFTRSGGVWSEVQKLLPTDGAVNDYFGYSVAISGDTALVGASDNDDLGAGSGSAYVFTRSGGVWSQVQKLLPADGATRDYFGFSVAILGDTALVGAGGNDDLGEASGSAYVFTRSGGVWSEVQKLLPADGAAHDFFGDSVAISGDTALVGAYTNDDFGGNSGSAYVFTRSDGVWSQVQKLLPADGAADDRFGFSVAISGDTAMVGAWGNDDLGGTSGSAYVFELSRRIGDFNGDEIVDLADIAFFNSFFTGPGVPVSAMGSPADADNDGDVDMGDFQVFSNAFTGDL